MMSDSLDDERLAIRCQLGERAAFDALIARWHHPLWKYARRITGSDDAASDAVQEAWLKVLRSIDRLRDPSKLRSWLFGIMRRVLMDRLRAEYSAPITAAAPEKSVVRSTPVTVTTRRIRIENIVDKCDRQVRRSSQFNEHTTF